VVAAARKGGLPVFFGDAGSASVLGAAGVHKASAVVITSHDPGTAASLVASLREASPQLAILVRARDSSHVPELLAAGATDVVPELAEASLLLGSAVLKVAGVPSTTIASLVAYVRQDVDGGSNTQ
jgi:CPA2 family monovalent cation:H+ antiporter-2